MGNTELHAEIKKYLSNVHNKTRNDKINICAHVYKILERSRSDAPDELRFFCEQAKSIESSNEEDVHVVIDDVIAKSLEKQFSTVVDSIFKQLLEKNLSTDEFYQKLWEIITSTPSFDSENAKVFALYYIWIDVRIPYFQLENGLTMSNSEFGELSELMSEEIQKVRFVLRTPMFKQRTARASVLLRLINGIEDERQQAVVMAHALAMYPGLSPEVLKDLIDKLKEETID